MPVTKSKSKVTPPAKAEKSSKVQKGASVKAPVVTKLKVPPKKALAAAKAPVVKVKSAPVKGKPAVKPVAAKAPVVKAKAPKVVAETTKKSNPIKAKVVNGEINVKETNKKLLAATKPVVIPPGKKYGLAKNVYGAGKEVVTTTLVGKAAARKG
jgi:hypothetical protein